VSCSSHVPPSSPDCGSLPLIVPLSYERVSFYAYCGRPKTKSSRPHPPTIILDPSRKTAREY